ncbi:MAG: DinB family protein [Thermomicrobiales bacterium]|nr:DinB family protein [Thermomicrobiales bacterium]
MNDEIIARIDAAWDAFLPSLDGLSGDDAARPGVAGYYSVKDILAHLAWWEDRTRETVESGSKEPVDVETRNDQIYAEYQDASFADMKQRLIDVHARARETFASTPNLTEADVEDDTWGHWSEHGEQIRAWRAANGV